MYTEILLSNIKETKNVCYDNATIKQKIVLNNGKIIVGTGFNNIQDNKLIIQQDQECIDLTNYENNGLESFIQSLKVSCN